MNIPSLETKSLPLWKTGTVQRSRYRPWPLLNMQNCSAFCASFVFYPGFVHCRGGGVVIPALPGVEGLQAFCRRFPPAPLCLCGSVSVRPEVGVCVGWPAVTRAARLCRCGRLQAPADAGSGPRAPLPAGGLPLTNVARLPLLEQVSRAAAARVPLVLGNGNLSSSGNGKIDFSGPSTSSHVTYSSMVSYSGKISGKNAFLGFFRI